MPRQWPPARRLPQHTRIKEPHLKTLYLHLGTHKAASTAIQLFLAHNRAQLAKHGICSPTPPPPTRFAHHGLAWHFIRQYKDIDQRPGNYSLPAALADFAASGCHTLILSSEDFLTCTPFPDFLEEFFRALRRVFSRIVVCAYVRDRKGFFRSSYNQWVKSLVYAGDFDSYLARVLRGNQAPMHYTRSLASWAEHADAAVYLPFLPRAGGEAVERHFLRALDIEACPEAQLQAFSSEAVNASVGPLSVLAHRRICAQLNTTDWFQPYDLHRRTNLTDHILSLSTARGWEAERFRVFDSQRLSRVREVFHGEDGSFARRHFGRDWDEVFPEEASEEQANERVYEDLSRSERSAVDQVVTQGTRRARAIYVDHPRISTYRANLRRSIRWLSRRVLQLRR